jgi:hypothetical protein
LRCDNGGRTPEINHGVDNRFAGSHVNNLNVEDHLDTLLVFDQIAADILSAGIVWALGHLSAEDAGVVAREDSDLRGNRRVVNIRKMCRVENGSSVSCPEVRSVCIVVSEANEMIYQSLLTGCKISLLTKVLCDGSAPLNGARLKTASLHLSSTMAEITLAVFHECSSLLDLVASIMAWVSQDAASQEG